MTWVCPGLSVPRLKVVVGGGQPVSVLLRGGALQACPGCLPCSHPVLLEETYIVRMTINNYPAIAGKYKDVSLQ